MADPKRTPDEPPADLVAYLDGELDARAARAVEKRLRADPKLRSLARSIKKTWGLLDYLPPPELSPTFSSRTLDKVSVIRPKLTTSQAAAALEPQPQPTPVIVPRAKPPAIPWVRIIGWSAAAAALFLVAFLASGSVGKKPPPEVKSTEDLMAQDWRVLDNLNLYQHTEDLAFVIALDHPDLFGDDASGR